MTESYIADGEVVAFKGDVTSFEQLQRRMQVRDPAEARRRGVKVFYYLFDLVYLNGYDLTNVPLVHRKALLKTAFESAIHCGTPSTGSVREKRIIGKPAARAGKA